MSSHADLSSAAPGSMPSHLPALDCFQVVVFGQLVQGVLG
jgi:hypothetical protein